jgi:hypothetical protein
VNEVVAGGCCLDNSHNAHYCFISYFNQHREIDRFSFLARQAANHSSQLYLALGRLVKRQVTGTADFYYTNFDANTKT